MGARSTVYSGLAGIWAAVRDFFPHRQDMGEPCRAPERQQGVFRCLVFLSPPGDGGRFADHSMTQWVDITVKLTPALITLVLGSIGVYIAWQQHRINRDKLRLDLFDKRLDAYECLQAFFKELVREGSIAEPTIWMLSEARYRCLFIFDDDINAHIEEVWNKAFELVEQQEQLFGSDELPVGRERSRASEQKANLLKWFREQQKDSPHRFAKYLRFT